MGAAFEAVLAVTKKVTVLIFALFCPRGLENAVNEVSGKALRGLQNKNGGADYPELRPRSRALFVPCGRIYAASSNCELYRSA